MLYDKVFITSFVVSIIAHIVFVLTPVHTFILPEIKIRDKQIEVNYYKKVVSITPKAILGKENKLIKSSKAEQKFLPEKKSSLDKTPLLQEKQHKTTLPATEKLHTATAVPKEKSWQIYHKDKDLSDQPSYLQYHNLIRSKIERMVNANKPKAFRPGQVYLIFTILKSGELLSVNVDDSISSNDALLQRVALNSVYAAAPFPPFNSHMPEDHLTLNVMILFER